MAMFKTITPDSQKRKAEELTDTLKPIFDYVYCDVNMEFLAESKEFVYEEDAVIQAFIILVAVPKKSRWWRPEWGTPRLMDLLFEPFDGQTADEIVNVIQIIGDQQANGDLGVVVGSIDVKMDYDTSTYVVEMELSIPRLEVRNKKVQFGLQKQG